jgi:2-methylcitrate dehydratase
MANLAEQLAEFALDIKFEELPPASVTNIKRLMIDTLGCALGALGCSPARIAEDMIGPYIMDDRASIIGSGRQTTAAGAALVNGTLTRYLDFMDVYSSQDVCHPSENIPAALALSEAAGASGKALIEAITVGYEAQLRICDALPLRTLGMHHVTSAGFAVPLIAGKLWHMPLDRIAHAVALGGVRHLTLSALSRGRLSMAKAIGYPLSAMETIFSTKLAAQGLTGPLESLDWLFTNMPGWKAPQAALDLDRGRYRLDRVSLKRYPVQFELQAPVELAARLGRIIIGETASIERIIIEVLPITRKRTSDPAKYRPTNRETADHSLPCCVAMALLDGDLTVHHFESDRWNAPDVAELMTKVEVEESDDFLRRLPNGRPASITIHRSGKAPLRDVQEIPLGDADRPMDNAAIEMKFRGLAEPALGTHGTDRVLEIVSRLDRVTNLRELTQALRTRP